MAFVELQQNGQFNVYDSRMTANSGWAMIILLSMMLHAEFCVRHWSV